MARQQERSVALVPDRAEVTMQKLCRGTCLEDCLASFYVSLSQARVIEEEETPVHKVPP